MLAFNTQINILSFHIYLNIYFRYSLMTCQYTYAFNLMVILSPDITRYIKLFIITIL